MSDDLSQVQQPYRSPQTAGVQHPVDSQKQSGLGIASFVIALVAGVIMIGTIAASTYFLMTSVASDDIESFAPMMALFGVGIIATALLHLLGFALGIAAVLQSNRKKRFGWLGLALNALAIFLVVALLAVGTIG